jgi:imidazolonepropionase-like amidohydrolase
MPGLIDAHFHAYATNLDLGKAEETPRSLHALEAHILLENALARGFTTVRDAAGADYGLAQATERGLIKGPRIFYSGRAITQTGGHGDSRAQSVEGCACSSHGMSWVADGPDEVRKAAREELRKGANQIKIFVSGGISSPSDPVWMPQFSDEEIKAAVAEAASRRTYVLAHAYTADSIARAVRCGVRSIEHGNLIDRAAAEVVRAHEAFVVPTLAVSESTESFPPPADARTRVGDRGEGRGWGANKRVFRARTRASPHPGAQIVRAPSPQGGRGGLRQLNSKMV